MEKNIKKNEQNPIAENTGEKISRKEAIRKAGYYGVSAATLMILLGTPKTAAASPASPPAW